MLAGLLLMASTEEDIKLANGKACAPHASLHRGLTMASFRKFVQNGIKRDVYLAKILKISFHNIHFLELLEVPLLSVLHFSFIFWVSAEDNGAGPGCYTETSGSEEQLREH